MTKKLQLILSILFSILSLGALVITNKATTEASETGTMGILNGTAPTASMIINTIRSISPYYFGKGEIMDPTIVGQTIITCRTGSIIAVVIAIGLLSFVIVKSSRPTEN